jgi:hypothetical protein
MDAFAKISICEDTKYAKNGKNDFLSHYNNVLNFSRYSAISPPVSGFGDKQF